MKKKAYKPQTVIKHLENDYQLGEDINVAFWKSPSRTVIMTLLYMFGSPEEMMNLSEAESERLNNEYYENASRILIDCDVEGISFETPESTRAAFDADFLPWGIFHQALVRYMAELLEENETLKNVLRRARQMRKEQDEDSSSGESSKTEEST